MNIYFQSTIFRNFFQNNFLTLKDGKELPKIIGFEGEDEETTSVSLLPTVHMKMENCQPEAEKIILQFLQEYFKVISQNLIHFSNN